MTKEKFIVLDQEGRIERKNAVQHRLYRKDRYENLIKTFNFPKIFTLILPKVQKLQAVEMTVKNVQDILEDFSKPRLKAEV